MVGYTDGSPAADAVPVRERADTAIVGLAHGSSEGAREAERGLTGVEDREAERRLRTYLTLSAAPEPARDPAVTPSAGELTAPRQLTAREYAELAHITESELRALWGDR